MTAGAEGRPPYRMGITEQGATALGWKVNHERELKHDKRLHAIMGLRRRHSQSARPTDILVIDHLPRVCV
jgi:hypothetical protein